MKRVTLDDILVKPKKIDIPVPNAKPVKNDQGFLETPVLTFYIRPSRQTERDLAASAARKESRTLRKKLEADGTEERERLVLDEIEDADLDSLRTLWVTEKVIERAVRIRRNSLEDRDYVQEPEGDDLTAKDLDDYENQVDEVEEQREIGVAEAINNARDELQAEVEKVSEEDLRKLAIPVQIEAVLNRLYETEFVHQLIYRCTFSDKACTKPAFGDVEQVYQLNDNAKTRLTNAHMGLMIDPEQVKNLAGGLRF